MRFINGLEASSKPGFSAIHHLPCDFNYRVFSKTCLTCWKERSHCYTLATVILLSYAKLLPVTIAALSVLPAPFVCLMDHVLKVVWLRDGN